MNNNIRFANGSTISSYKLGMGPQGITGNIGTQGIQGSLGVQGISGPQGPPGNIEFPLDMDCSNIIDVSGIYFCNGTAITSFIDNSLTISGSLVMDNYSIFDVSQITFSDGTTFGEGSSFDINANQTKLDFKLKDVSMGNFNNPATTDFIKGLNVNFGIQRIATIAGTISNSWEDGFMGNSSAMVFTAADMVCSEGVAATQIIVGGVRTDISINDVQITSKNPGSGSGTSGLNPARVEFYGPTSRNGKVICQKIIPKGFKITPNSTCTVYTPTTSRTISMYISTYDITDFSNNACTPLYAMPTASYNTNYPTQSKFYYTVYGNGTTLLNIYMDFGVTPPVLTLDNKPSGAIVTMERF